MKRNYLFALSSIAFSLIGISLFSFSYYVNENFAMPSQRELLNIYRSIPEPTTTIKNTLSIRKKWISPYILAEMKCPNLDSEEGIFFFTEYLSNNGWNVQKIKIKHRNNGTCEYILNATKGEVFISVNHREIENTWGFFLIKEDWVYNWGL